MTRRAIADAGTSPLPLVELSERISPKTYQWINEADLRDAKMMNDLKEDEAFEAFAFFRRLGGDDESDEDDEEDGKVERVQEWISSVSNVDGIGGYTMTVETETKLCQDIEEEEEEDASSIKVKYILSDKAGGHGDDLWAASRYIANMLADPSKCRDFLNSGGGGDCGGVRRRRAVGRKNNLGGGSGDYHPLLGLRLLELGAGGGLPSWLAMKCGAEVVCTDQSIPDRIRCLAECAQRNLNDLKVDLVGGRDDEGNHDLVLKHAEKVRICPYDWGSATDEVISDLRGDKNADGFYDDGVFDVVVAADCVYIPQCHGVLLDSIMRLMSKCGVALLPFALHGNTKDENIWAILELAKEKGFFVDVLEPVQLTPQSLGMDMKRGLVNMIRLKKI